MKHYLLTLQILSILTLIISNSCVHEPQPTYVRGTNAQWLDEPAMGVGLDKRDLESLMNTNLDSLIHSPWWNRYSPNNSNKPAVALMPISNLTTEHIDSQLDTLLAMVETRVVNSSQFTVIAGDLRNQIIEELHLQQTAEFDQSKAVALGRQRGIHYFITGKIFDNSERTSDLRRVQYFLFMQIVSVETGEIVWQNQADVTKGIVPM